MPHREKARYDHLCCSGTEHGHREEATMRWQPQGLWRHPDFVKLWAGRTISEFGSRITREGLPLAAALVLGAGPEQMALLAAMGAAPVLLVGLLAGVWVDR